AGRVKFGRAALLLLFTIKFGATSAGGWLTPCEPIFELPLESSTAAGACFSGCGGVLLLLLLLLFLAAALSASARFAASAALVSGTVRAGALAAGAGAIALPPAAGLPGAVTAGWLPVVAPAGTLGCVEAGKTAVSWCGGGAAGLRIFR